MYNNNKPEYYDPAEKNLTQYSYRSNLKKGLADSEDCCSKKKMFYIGANGANKTKMILFFALLLTIFYLFAQRNLDQKSELQNTEGQPYKITFSAFSIAGESKLYLQLIVYNTTDNPLEIKLENISIELYSQLDSLLEKIDLGSKSLMVKSKNFEKIELQLPQNPLFKTIKFNYQLNQNTITIEKLL